MNWIQKLGNPDNILLTDLVLPGTHNSAAYQLNWSVINPHSVFKSIIYLGCKFLCFRKSITKWAITQQESIYDQLTLGARFLDLRLVEINNIWYLHHEVICLTLDEGLQQIIKFVKKNKEPVVLSMMVSNLTKNNIDILTNKINEYLNDYIWKKDKAPINEMIKTGKLIYIILDNLIDFNIPDIFRVYSNYLNISYRTINPEIKIRYLYTNLEHIYQNNVFINLSFTLTPGFCCVICYFFSHKSRKTLDKKIKKRLEEFINHDKIDRTNVISFDFFNEEINQIIESLNKEIILKNRVNNLIQ